MEHKINKLEQYTSIKEKLKNNLKLTYEDKIFMKRYELEKLKEEEKQDKEKKRNKRIKNINRILNVEIEKKYNETDNENIDIKLASLFLYALENSDELFQQIDLESYVERTKRGSIIRKETKENKLGEINNGNTTHS